ncbi:Putative ovule protein [Arachis hypogaea]|nr:Putative ovule protein [Arachis hypogaea]
MSLKGRGQGVDLGTSTLSLIRSIIFSFFGLALPYDPLNLFPFFVFLSPRPHTVGKPPPPHAVEDAVNHLAVAAMPHRCIALLAIQIQIPSTEDAESSW